MKKQAFNPYLPSYEYVPDGEPHVFGDRLYVYGSHDRFGGEKFCMNDYMCWSAPLDDLADWRYEGVIYRMDSNWLPCLSPSAASPNGRPAQRHSVRRKASARCALSIRDAVMWVL